MSPIASQAPARGRLATLVAWFDAWAVDPAAGADDPDRVDWLRVVPFLALHVACLAVFWVGWSWTAVAVAAGFYLARMFAITAFYHRYFSHKAFKTSRAVQFLGALLGAASVQRGPLWWAAHHRAHHRHSDREDDVHSPVRRSFLWSHMVWFLARGNFRTRLELVPDLARFRELRFLDRFDVLVPLLLIPVFWGAGAALEAWAPGLGVTGAQLFVWGFVISTVALYHCTFTINSLAHRWGSRRYETRDDSRNNLALALITLGEGWHNNHHHYAASARQGFRWWEVDVSYYALRALAAVGLVWDLRPVPARVLNPRERT